MIDDGVDPGDHHDELWRRYGETVAVLVMDTSAFSRTCSSHGVVHFLTRLMHLRRLCQPVLQAHCCMRLHSETMEGCFGEAMNYASKLGEDLASGDETYITDSAFNNALSALLSAFQPATSRISGVTIHHHRHCFIRDT